MPTGFEETFIIGLGLGTGVAAIGLIVPVVGVVVVGTVAGLAVCCAATCEFCTKNPCCCKRS